MEKAQSKITEFNMSRKENLNNLKLIKKVNFLNNNNQS